MLPARLREPVRGCLGLCPCRYSLPRTEAASCSGSSANISVHWKGRCCSNDSPPPPVPHPAGKKAEGHKEKGKPKLGVTNTHHFQPLNIPRDSSAPGESSPESHQRRPRSMRKQHKQTWTGYLFWGPFPSCTSGRTHEVTAIVLTTEPLYLFFQASHSCQVSHALWRWGRLEKDSILSIFTSWHF